MLLGIGAVLRLDESGSLRMENTRLEDAKVVLERGSALVEVTETVKNTRIRIYFRDTAVEFTRPGLFRFDASLAQMRVYGGEAAVSNARRKTRIKRGQAGSLTGSLAVSKFDLKTQDALHRWAARRSFDLVNLPELVWKQKQWQPTNLGRLWNENFGMEFSSEEVAREIVRRNAEYLGGRAPQIDNGHLGITNPSGVKPSPQDSMHQGPSPPQQQN